MIRAAIIVLTLLVSTPLFAVETRQCAIDATNVVVGCTVIDPAQTPPPPGTTWVADPNKQGGPKATYDPGTQTFSAPPFTPEQQAEKEKGDAREAHETAMKTQTDVADLANRLATATPAQIDTWVDNNMTNLAQARAVVKAMLKVMAYTINTSP